VSKSTLITHPGGAGESPGWCPLTPFILLFTVDYWRNSDQKHRWLAATLLDIEPRLRKVKGYRYLPQLRVAIQKEIDRQTAKKDHMKEAA
jgi:hypothetical protein